MTRAILFLAIAAALGAAAPSGAERASSPNFRLQTAEWVAGSESAESPEFSGEGLVGPTAAPGQAEGGDFGIATGELAFTLDVEVDVRPYSRHNHVWLGPHGVVPIAILSSPAFDAADVDRTVDPGRESRIRFAGATARAVGRARKVGFLRDVDRDGDRDLVLIFSAREIDPELLRESEGETYGTVEGRTRDGVAFQGSDLLRIHRPKRWKPWPWHASGK